MKKLLILSILLAVFSLNTAQASNRINYYNSHGRKIGYAEEQGSNIQYINVPREPSGMENFSKAIGKALEQYNERQQQINAAQQLGINPAILSLPESAQSAYYNNVFQNRGY